MGDFIVREWLAAHLGREPDQLDLTGAVRAAGRGQEARYDVDGGGLAMVTITWATPGGHGRTSRTVMARLPRGEVIDVIDGSERVVW